MISAKIKKTVTDAIALDGKAQGKWYECGAAVAAEYTDRAAVEGIRAQFLSEVIYPAMGDAAVKLINADVPAKNHKDYIGATAEQRLQWDSMKATKATVRGMGSVYFGRVLKYAFGAAEKAEQAEQAEKAKATPRGRIAARLGEAATMIQKQEALPEHDKALLVALAAWQAVEAKAST